MLLARVKSRVRWRDLRKIASRREHGSDLACLWPRRRALAHSDIDLAISIGTPIPPERLALLHDAVDNIATLYQIDLVDLNTAGPGLREEVLKYGERL